jgi:hypothetical protein
MLAAGCSQLNTGIHAQPSQRRQHHAHPPPVGVDDERGAGGSFEGLTGRSRGPGLLGHAPVKRRLLTAGLGLLLGAGCGSATLPDGGLEPLDDAGLELDASTAFDAGTFVDAGALDSGVRDAGVFDAGTVDAGMSSDAGVIDAGVSGKLVYPTTRLHSPVTRDVVEHLRAIAALSSSQQNNVFSKIGDSNTVNTNYLSCFGGANVDLAGRSALQPVIDHFKTGMVGTGSPFARTSLSATVGWSAQGALQGTPSPLQQEIDAARPRYATVMFGTNDVGFMNVDLYGRSLFTIVDTLSMQGVVPVVSSVPPRDDNATSDLWVGRYNLVARAVAQARKVPFIDLNRQLQSVPTHGLGGDGIHLNVYTPAGSARGCVMTAAGLDFGHNVRNLATLEGLDRAWRAVEDGTAFDTTAPRRSGSGRPGEEIVISSLPFVDDRDTRVDGAANIDHYPGCGSAANESGREVLYRLELAQPTNVRAFVISLGTADIDIHLLSAAGPGSACVVRNDKVITRQLSAGTYWLSLDTYQGSGGLLPGEYVLVVMAD